MRKIALTMVMATLLSAFSAFGTGAQAAEVGSTYKFGGDTAIEGQDGTGQGQNGWYYMWSPEYNKKGTYDVSEIKESVYSETGSAMIPYLSGGKGWIADIYAGDDYEGGANWTNWWTQSSDGTMNPAVTQNAAMNEKFASVVLGWKVPENGKYSVNLTYTAGGQSYWDDATAIDYPSTGDGVTVSIYTDSEKLYSQATTIKGDATALQYNTNDWNAAPVAVGDPYTAAFIDKDVTTTATAELNAGQMLYIIVDPNQHGGEDTAKVKVEVTKVGNLVDNKTVFKFGGADAINGQDGTEQGQNGWYYMWSPEHNMNGVFDIGEVKESTYSETGSAHIPYLPGLRGWIPDIYAGDDYEGGANWTNWWRQTSDGIMNPAVTQNAANTEIFASAVLGWMAPESGEYSFNLVYTAGGQAYWDDGTSTDYPSTGDGVTVSMYAAGNKLYSKATTLQEGATALQYDPNNWDAAPVAVGEPYEAALLDKDVVVEKTNITLKKGEMFYLFIDPNANGAEDVTTVTVEVVQTQVSVDDSEDNSNNSTEQEDTEIPKTGDTSVTVAILFALIVLSAFVMVINSKKRAR